MRLTPRLSALDGAQRGRLALHWRLEALDHQSSISASSCVVLQLLAMGAPTKLVRAAEGAGRDEIAHTELCLAMAGAYGGRPMSRGQPTSTDPMQSFNDPIAIVIHTVQVGCIGETIRAALATTAAQRTTDPAVRQAFVRIAADETRHAALAWRCLKWMLNRDRGSSLVHVASATFDRQLGRFRSRVARATPSDDRWLDQQGMLAATARPLIAVRTMEDVVMPCARVLLAGRETDKTVAPTSSVA